MWRVVALAVLVAGCGYALAGSSKSNNLPPHIKRIGVPTFQNLTPYPDLDRLFTEAVRDELRARRRYEIVPDATGVDAVLTISIQSLTGVVTAFTADTKLASRYSLTVILSGDFKDMTNNTALWTKPSLRLADDYDVPNDVATSDLASLFVQDRNALERIAKKFAQGLVPAILSAW